MPENFADAEMKFFDCDWNRIFDVLPLWAKLSPDSRRHFLLAVPSHAQTVNETATAPT